MYGNGVNTKRTYNPTNGQLLSIYTTDGVQTLQDLSYSYDHLNNVKSRADGKLNYSESYEYDDLERLTQSTLTVTGLSSATRDWSYDKVGNLETIDSSSFSYDETDKLRAIPDQSKTYEYDANGNQKENAGRTITWSSFNKPIKLKQGTQQTEFIYNADHSRMRKLNKDSLMLTKDTVYFGNYEKIIESNGNIEHRYHVSVGNSVVAIRSVKTDAAGLPLSPASSNYLHKDALGSVDLITDDKAAEVVRLAYTPYGKRRNIDALQELTDYGSLSISNFTPLLTTRGYTGHEHIDELDLIHMNGRVYDPDSGRFMSADPYVYNPYSTQGFNRYSYVRGNPLKYVDPSGFYGSPSNPHNDQDGGVNAGLGGDGDGGGYTNPGNPHAEGDDNSSPPTAPVDDLSNGDDFDSENASWSGFGVEQQVADQGFSMSSLGGYEPVMGVLDYVWEFIKIVVNIPTTLIGGLVFGLAHLYGEFAQSMGWSSLEPEIDFGFGTIQFLNNPLMPKYGAIVIGNISAYGYGWGPNTIHEGFLLGAQEQAHVSQHGFINVVGFVLDSLFGTSINTAGLLGLTAQGSFGLAGMASTGEFNHIGWHSPANLLEQGPHPTAGSEITSWGGFGINY